MCKASNGALRCGSCIHGVLTGILPNGVLEYACCVDTDPTPIFYYSASPERVTDCFDYTPNYKNRTNIDPVDLKIEGSYYEYD